MKGKLYLVSMPIGNPDDITLRALKILKEETDFIICEKQKPARRMLSNYDIKKELYELNKNNEKDIVNDIILRIINGETPAIISDAGTPLFSDPGHLLVEVCISQKIQIIPVPGANSLLPALTGSGLDIEQFYYYGWLSANKYERRQQLNKFKNIKELLVILETPYRLQILLADIVKVLGKKIRVVVAYKLTMKEEQFFRGTAEEVLRIVEKKNLKGEFVLLVDNR